MSKSRKDEQLGMSSTTARMRLTRDLLYKMVCDTGNNMCFRCGKPMTREDFTIEHKKAWLDSDDPPGLFFDLENISFSHMACNSKESRNGTTAHRNAMIKAGKKARMVIPEGMSHCSNCGFLPVECFGRDKSTWHGYAYLCKKCRRNSPGQVKTRERKL